VAIARLESGKAAATGGDMASNKAKYGAAA